jgi:hypothetical protein
MRIGRTGFSICRGGSDKIVEGAEGTEQNGKGFVFFALSAVDYLAIQFSSFSPRTRLNSHAFDVIKIAPSARA